MSLFDNSDPMPSRIAGVVRYLLVCEGYREPRARLEAIMSPPGLRDRERGTPAPQGTLMEDAPRAGRMIRNTVNECLHLGLIEKVDDEVQLSGPTRAAFPKGLFDGGLFRRLILERLLTRGSEERQAGDMEQDRPSYATDCQLLAWFLGQNPSSFVGNQSGMDALLADAGVTHRFFLKNNVRYPNFCYWVPYLGLGWVNSVVGPGARLVPDPAAYLESQLPRLYREGPECPVLLSELSERLGRLCPLFEGGNWHAEVARWLPKRSPSQFPPAVSLAWLRLSDRGRIRLERRADAQGVELLDGPTAVRFTHAVWAGDTARAAEEGQ